MKRVEQGSVRRLVRAARLGALSLVTVGATGAVGCLSRPLEPVDPRITSTIIERLTQSSVDKIDLLFAIDNSRSMADKQGILAAAVPDLVKGLVNPKCLDDNGVPAASQPATPVEECPPGTRREFEPVLDIHIGILSSSIGGHGADACAVIPNDPKTASNNDGGLLLARLDANGGADVPTYQGKKFLAWDPKTRLEPPGETDVNALIGNLTDMVKGTGQIGCGYEAQLESIYRFLVDTEPYDTIAVDNQPSCADPDPTKRPDTCGKVVTSGIDATLLAQRADFMRPNSLLAIIMLTDENDCSIKESGQFYLAAQLNTSVGPYHLPAARAACQANPNDPCCRSCGQPAGKDASGAACPEDTTCATLDALSDDANLRCWDQKRRFGIDFLYPYDRYVQAFTSVTIPNRAGELVPNPIFSDLNPNDDISNVRDAGLVFLAGIVGVPWQDISRSPGSLSGGLKTADELSTPLKDINPAIDPAYADLTTWDIILGDPDGDPTTYTAPTPPADPLMVESVDPRSGTNPFTGAAIAPPGSPVGTNPINGHEYTIGSRDDLQYACIFDLPTARNCGPGSTEVSCDCSSSTNDNPLCDANPDDNGSPTLQTRAKAYPGLRELQVLKGLGGQGIVGSVCPAQVSDDTLPDFGYRPAIGAIIERLKIALGGQCLPRTLTPDDQGQVSCLILEARKSEGECTCDPNIARSDVSDEHKAAKDAAANDPVAKNAGWNCYCEIDQLTGDGLKACQTDLNPAPIINGNEAVDGWCYIDATTSPPTGDPQLVEKCPATEKRLIRFVGNGEAQAGATLFITCSGE
jgi:hypothetical protein